MKNILNKIEMNKLNGVLFKQMKANANSSVKEQVINSTLAFNSNKDPIHLELKKSLYLKKLRNLISNNNNSRSGEKIKGTLVPSFTTDMKRRNPNLIEDINPLYTSNYLSKINKTSLLKSKGYEYISLGHNLKKLPKNFISSYLMNNLNSINLMKNIGDPKVNGILLNYNKIIAYNFNNSTSINTPSSLRALRVTTLTEGGASLGLNKRVEVFGYKKDVKDTYSLLSSFFKSIYCLISKPVFLHTPDKITIQLFYYLNVPKKKVFKLFSFLYLKSFKEKWLSKKSQTLSLRRKGKFGSSTLNLVNGSNSNFKPFIRWKVRKAISRLRSKTTYVRDLLFTLRKVNLIRIFAGKLQILCSILSNKFNKPVELQLIRLHHPYHDSNILVNLLSLNLKNKRKKSRIAINKIYNKRAIKKLNDPSLTSINSIPNFLSGLNIKIAGRLMREPIVPRMTTKVFSRGASSPGKVNYLDIATITNKNRKGAYTITIKSGQNFFPLINNKTP